MEGISAEAASLAGHLKLSNLCWIYDSNQITIEGSTELAFTEDVATRFEGYGWAVQHVDDANDLDALTAALEAFKAETGKPTMIIVKSVIAWGAPTKAGHHSAHGEPLGVEEIKGAKRFYGWPEDESFVVPDAVREHFAEVGGKRGAEARQAWDELFAAYGKEYPELAEQLDNMQRRQLPDGWDADLPTFDVDAKGVAGRDASAQGAQRGSPAGAVADRRLGRPGPVEQVPAHLRGRRRLLRRRTGRAATCTSASASTPPARWPTASPCPRSGPTRPAS